ncbi:thioredoxin-like protein [Scopulibacillus darangshiensis]|uniref:Thioredoxin-like protein n=2 Tax=Scopulibacillus darangshiensis TaxID=442528 RepID=A0A4R2NGP5_9BACL|nr:thioredoxin-like protein [Scopulibacillus darangshiensis]
MIKNIGDWLGKGISPETFMKKMKKNRDLFESKYQLFHLTEEDEAFFTDAASKNIRCVIITADWCGDAARSIPVVFQIMESAGIPIEVFIVDDNPDLIDQFRVLGGRSVPVVLFTSDNGDVLGQWGPRPAYIQEPMVEFKALGLDPESEEYQTKIMDVRKEIVRRYGEGAEYQPLVVKELRELLKEIS